MFNQYNKKYYLVCIKDNDDYDQDFTRLLDARKYAYELGEKKLGVVEIHYYLGNDDDQRAVYRDTVTVGHVCIDGSFCKWKANSCLSCGGWDGVSGRNGRR